MSVRLSFALLSLAVVLGGCRTTMKATRVVAPANELRVFNRGARIIGGVRIRTCGSPDSAYQWLPASQVVPGHSLAIALREGCIDLSAVSAEGDELGRQFDLYMIAGSTWEIR